MVHRTRALTRSALLITVLACSVVVRAAAEDSSNRAPAPRASNAELDALFEAKDWGHLTAALYPPPNDGDSFGRNVNWLRSKLDAGAGFLMAYSYMRYLWILGETVKLEDPGKDPRVTAAVIALYAIELIAVDGPKCEDGTAPSHRMDQLRYQEPAVFAFLKSRPAELKEKLVAIAIAYEQRTAPIRKDDDVLCSGGMDQMRAGLERGTSKEVPTPPGQVGKTVAVTPPTDWVPKYLPPEAYTPKQTQARAGMRDNLLKLVQ